MPYFERSNKFANILIFFSIIFFLIAVVVIFKGSVLDQVFQYSNGNYVSSGIYFTIFILLSVFTCIVAIALKCVVKDARYEFAEIKRELSGKS
ncbi:hypothetical protein CLHUN_39780 [Ruminiclostridium hungatei]|uniref:Uncharacterized protein n=1 Tax=Ruminiclostridium hungatei TaxID=48256 RepID=A0A1V4SG05_RUMHU|nr:hypothetical protein [Ruminiclostridium hungatei]OPX42191.1 hypothetical protein CLHUN_39780 [Ruminiclostridium hungatei]